MLAARFGVPQSPSRRADAINLGIRQHAVPRGVVGSLWNLRRVVRPVRCRRRKQPSGRRNRKQGEQHGRNPGDSRSPFQADEHWET